MSRISLVIVSVMLCAGGQLSAGTIPTGPILPNDSNETYEQRFLASFPEETGVLLDYDVIDDIDRDELT
jgi:hypothetical protein